MLSIRQENGIELISVGEDITLFDDAPFHEGSYTRLTREIYAVSR